MLNYQNPAIEKGRGLLARPSPFCSSAFCFRLDINTKREYDAGQNMAHNLSFFRLGIFLVMSLLLSFTLNAKTTRLRDIYGAESLLSLDESQALVESAEDAFYRAEYATAFESVQRALKITQEKLGDTNRDMVNILSLLGEGQMLLGDYVEANKSLTRAFCMSWCNWAIQRTTDYWGLS